MDLKKLHDNPPYGMIAILFIGAFVALLNNTLLNVALPVIMTEFSVSPAIVQWLTTGFMLVNGILIPASAFLIQKFTNRGLFITAMSLFSLGTFISMVAPIFSVLVIGRMVQASGSAIMMPLLMNVMLTAFPIEKRGRVMGMFGLVMITAPAIGPTLSGWLIQHYDWRLLFGVVLPIAIFTLIFAFFKLKNITPNRDVKLDVMSLVLSTIGFGGVLYGFSSAGEKGWSNPLVFITVIVGTISLITFVVRQIKLPDPMLEIRIYKYPMFALSSVISVVLSMSMFSAMILTPLYVQTVRGISPMESGILMLPGAIIMGIMSPITGRLFDKYGARALAIIGLTITVITTFQFSKLDLQSGYYFIMTIFTVRMFGISLVMMPIMTNGLNQLPMKYNPHGTAMNNTLQQVSGAIGSALLLTVMNKRMESVAEKLFTEASLANKVPTSEAAFKAFEIEIAKKSMLDGINFSFFISAIIAVVALFLTFFVKRVTPAQYEGAEGK